jgi:integrase/recombinase XerD
MHDDIERFLRILEGERGFSINTIFAYRNDLGQFLVYLQTTPGSDADQSGAVANRQIDLISGTIAPVNRWDELSDVHLTSYVLYLRERAYAASTVARKAAAIKSFCHFLLQEGQMRSDPAAKMASPKVDKYTPRSISREEIDRLLEQPGKGDSQAANRPEAIRDRAMLETLYATGMRVSELVALNNEDIILSKGQLRAGPRGRDRMIPLRERARAAVAHYVETARPMLDLRSEVALFLNHRGSRLTRQGFWLILKSYAQQADISGITPHTLRHTFAAHQLRDGAELGEVQRILGHVNISTTQVYQRLVNNGGDRPSLDPELDLGALDPNRIPASEQVVAASNPPASRR